MLKSYKKVWSVCRTYNVEVGTHSTEAAAEADLQKVLGSRNWADARSTNLKAVEIAQKHADWLNDYGSLTIGEEVDKKMDDILERRTVDTWIRSEISGYEVAPRDLLTEILHPEHSFPATMTVVIEDRYLLEPEIDSYWEITRWGRLRQKVAGRLFRLADRITVHDPDYDPDYYYD